MERRGLLRGAAVRLLAALGAAVLCLSAIPAEAAVGGQVADAGGTREAAEDGVTVGKTIAATELENVFDITLTVETGSDISVTYRDPDMAVVIVMDISNTMKYAFDGTSRYLAAIGAAGRFLERFAAETGSENNKTGSVTISATAQTITFTNTKEIPVNTGVILDTLPYVLMLIAVGGGVVAFFLRRRHHDDEE